MSTLAARHRRVAERVAEAAARAGRRPEDVTIVAVAKTFPPSSIAEAAAAGVRDVGESYVQEARDKRSQVAAPLRWHLVGRLQRNKANLAAALFDVVHSLDSLPLAEALDRAAARAGRILPCLVEVNLGGERTKGGIAPERLRPLLEATGALTSLALVGLMAVPPLAERSTDNRPYFRRLAALREALRDLRMPNVQLKELSMGMSGDFEVAVEEGATLVRIGTAIFGAREPFP